MRYSSSVAVLATLAIGQAAAGSIQHRHLHNRREAKAEAKPWQGVCGQSFGTWGVDTADCPGGVAPAAATSVVAPKQQKDVVAQAVPTSTPQTNDTTDTTTTKKTTTSDKKTDNTASTSNSDNVASTGGSAVSDLSAAVFSSLGNSLNSVNTGSGLISDQDMNAYTAVLSNESGEELGFYCWQGYNWDPQTSASQQPIYAATIPKSSKHTMYLAENTPMVACVAVYPDTVIGHAGQPQNTWMEFTMAPSTSDATFDLSQLPMASGHPMTIDSSVCESTLTNCNFVCKTGSAPCDIGRLVGCTGSGANKGVDPYTKADSGGCQVGPTKLFTAHFQ